MRCAAPLHLYDIAVFDTKNIFSRIMTDDGQTTQGKPLRHITPGQENIEIPEDSLHRRETFVFLDILVKLVVCAVAVIPTSKKYLAARRKRLGTYLSTAPYSITKMK